MKVDIRTAKFEEMENRTFEVVQVTDNLCEFCRQPVSREERPVRVVNVSSRKDYESLLTRAFAHDRVEVDLDVNRIYLYDHVYRCDFHPECVKRT